MTASPLLPTSLRCAQQVNPMGVSPDRVRLSWALRGTGRDRRQRAYQIRLWTDTPDDQVWDSGRVESPESVDISCAGPLVRGRGYAWRVRVWDEGLISSQWSEPAWFEVELDPVDGWRGSWIGLDRIRENVSPPVGRPDPVAKALPPVPYLRCAFTLDQPPAAVASARLYVTALGLYEARTERHEG